MCLYGVQGWDPRMEWAAVMQQHPKQDVLEPGWIPLAFSPGGPWVTEGHLAGPCELGLCTAWCSLGPTSKQVAFVAMFALLLAKSCPLNAAEELKQPWLRKLILPLLIVQNLQYFPPWIIYNILFWECGVCLCWHIPRCVPPALFSLE